MGEPRTFVQKIGLTRGKAMLIALLAVVLVGVIYVQIARFSDGDIVAASADAPEYRPPGPPRTALPIAQAAADVPAASTHTATAAVFDQAKWAPPELAAVTAFDPFALPAMFPQPPTEGAPPLADGAEPGATAARVESAALADAVEALRMELTALQERGVHVIVRDGDRYVALIGDRTVHVGDEINGFTVTAIEPDGVHVERNIRE